MFSLNETHDPARRSWIESANRPDTDFPVQNLPFAVFATPNRLPRVGVGIGDQILDVARVAPALEGLAAQTAAACAKSQLNDLMALGPKAWSALRLALSRMLGSDAGHLRDVAEPHLIPLREATLRLPVRIGNFSDFFASVFHATNAGRMFRPDNPLMPNYKYVPVAYHSRVSSVRVSGTPVRRPSGQRKGQDEAAPTFGPSRNLDYELELGAYVGVANELGTSVPIGRAGSHVFGFSLLNDWSARDIQAWEYQPLGPFLAKSFATTVGPWVVTTEALAPFRTHAFRRPAGDPAPLPHLLDGDDQLHGGFDITLDVLLSSLRMRETGQAPVRVSRGSFATSYWTMAQMVAHHTSNGCNLEVGDLIGSGTVSGPDKESWGSLLELTARGREPLSLTGGEQRGFLADGDEVIFRGHCGRVGHVSIGFGECRALVMPAI